ncbi:hypothetical protein CAC42_5020 [Sphaceloma murrayae]|uniref:Uncharacterized protein n=1 Tax=Sphaceloma murrayae TaxID=2082308 RepID=A0A2K1QPM6_9PEZI|nr:hypothetical protein CAC42_5020 [Sphaceloma murrayae]
MDSNANNGPFIGAGHSYASDSRGPPPRSFGQMVHDTREPPWQHRLDLIGVFGLDENIGRSPTIAAVLRCYSADNALPPFETLAKNVCQLQSLVTYIITKKRQIDTPRDDPIDEELRRMDALPVPPFAHLLITAHLEICRRAPPALYFLVVASLTALATEFPAPGGMAWCQIIRDVLLYGGRSWSNMSQLSKAAFGSFVSRVSPGTDAFNFIPVEADAALQSCISFSEAIQAMVSLYPRGNIIRSRGEYGEVFIVGEREQRGSYLAGQVNAERREIVRLLRAGVNSSTFGVAFGVVVDSRPPAHDHGNGFYQAFHREGEAEAAGSGRPSDDSQGVNEGTEEVDTGGTRETLDGSAAQEQDAEESDGWETDE